MKLQKVFSWFGLLLLIATVSGCAQLVQDTPTPSLIAPTVVVTSTIVATTATPMLTPSATNTPIPSAIPTDVPALSAEDARQRLLTLLSNNNDCRLPCLWGITPGKSNYQEARDVLMPLSSIGETVLFDQSYPGDGITPQYIDGDLRLGTSVSYLYRDDGIITKVSFRVMQQQLSKDEYGNTIKTPIFDSPTFMKRIEYYSLAHILSEQGKPDSVMLQVSRSVVNGFMDIALLYPDQGIWVNYTMLMFDDKNFVVEHGCPANSYVNMFLSSPGDSASFLALLDKTDWGITKSGYKPLEETTSMSVEEFYQTFQKPTDKCIETPANLWPEPEAGGG